MRRFSLVSLLVMMVAGLWACQEESTAPGEEETVLVHPGKADNFFSLSAQEYYVQGDSYVQLESSYASASDAERDARVKELIYYRQIAINWFLLRYLMGNDEHKNQYNSLTKNGSYEDLEIRQDESDPLKYWFRFQQEAGGQLDLLRQLPTTVGEDGLHHFPLPVGIVANTQLDDLELNSEWYRRSPWSDFDAAKVDASKVEYIDLTIFPQQRSSDAWMDYQALFADGVVDIGVHFGWDYHNEYHIVHSRDVYNWLVNQQGFKSPVSSYDEYTRKSGPLTKTITANGKPVEFKISLYWGKVGTDADPDTAAGGRVLEEDMRYSFANREVIVFSGHSGPFYGFALANWRKTDEGDLDDSKIAGLELPAKTYQVVLAEGCDTYALGEAFAANPAKPDKQFLDIITTTNFSNASDAGVVRNFLTAIFGSDRNGHIPTKYSELLRKLDGNSYWFKSMYGVHGIDDNPRLHPYAVVDNFCKTCSRDSDCGGPGNKCTRVGDDEKVCTGECLDSAACPAGYVCMDVASSSYITSKQCVPEALTCKQPIQPPVENPIIINEVLADPSGDANGDGKFSTTQDEFVELVNISADAVDLSGWAIADAVSTRFIFPDGSKLAAGKALVVFGGGQPALAGVDTYVASSLGMNNTGDHIKLLKLDGSIADELVYGAEGGRDASLVRSTDADADAAFVAHPELPFSPGTKQDGSAF